jgi:hypothetical protein
MQLSSETAVELYGYRDLALSALTPNSARVTPL